MKKILLALILFFSLLSANESITKSILTNVLQKQIKNAITAVTELQKTKKSQDFYALVRAWKKVQASYVAGDIDPSSIDTPRLIDMYHNSNDDLNAQMKLIMLSNDGLKISLFKNSYKSINALEYLLFTKDKISKTRKKQALEIVLKNIKSKLESIQKVYTLKNSKVFLDNEVGAYSMLVNQLIPSVFKLKDWRIGEPSGLAQKYLGKPNAKRAEYPLAKASFMAIDAVIDANLALVAKQKYKNLYQYAVKKGYKKEINQIVMQLKIASKISKNIDTEDFGTKKVKKLFKALSNLQQEYQGLFVLSLNIPLRIIEADGD